MNLWRSKISTTPVATASTSMGPADSGSRSRPRRCPSSARREPARGLAARRAGASAEDNAFSVSIHWRGVAEADRPRVAGAVDAVLALAPFGTTLRKFSGKCVFELRPSAAWNKGEAALYLLDMVRKAEGGAHDWFDGVQPIYAGDDVTDEDAFKALAPFGAVRRPRGARGRVRAAGADARDAPAPRRRRRARVPGRSAPGAGGGAAGATGAAAFLDALILSACRAAAEERAGGMNSARRSFGLLSLAAFRSIIAKPVPLFLGAGGDAAFQLAWSGILGTVSSNMVRTQDQFPEV